MEKDFKTMSIKEFLEYTSLKELIEKKTDEKEVALKKVLTEIYDNFSKKAKEKYTNKDERLTYLQDMKLILKLLSGDINKEKFIDTCNSLFKDRSGALKSEVLHNCDHCDNIKDLLYMANELCIKQYGKDNNFWKVLNEYNEEQNSKKPKYISSEPINPTKNIDKYNNRIIAIFPAIQIKDVVYMILYDVAKNEFASFSGTQNTLYSIIKYAATNKDIEGNYIQNKDIYIINETKEPVVDMLQRNFYLKTSLLKEYSKDIYNIYINNTTREE